MFTCCVGRFDLVHIHFQYPLVMLEQLYYFTFVDALEGIGADKNMVNYIC